MNGLGAVGIRTADALVAANNGVAKVQALQTGEGIRGSGLRHVDAVEASQKLGVRGEDDIIKQGAAAHSTGNEI